jgi:F0F1-type ATP synthase membrane subunit b/b'
VSTDPGQAQSLTSLPTLEELPRSPGGGYEPDGVRAAFDGFRRHVLQLQAQLRVLQAAGRTANVDPTGHAVRMDALHLIRAAAEMADTIERDAQSASATQFRRTEEEVTRRQHELKQKQGEVDRYRTESERQRAEMLNAAKAEARQTVQEAEQKASQEIKEAESRAARLLEQARHQATELTNSARAEVEQTLEWARSQAGVIINRAQEGAEQVLSAAGLGDDVIGRVAESIVDAAKAAAEGSRGPSMPQQEESAPPLSPPVSPGPPPPSPAAETEPAPKGEGDGNDG